MSAVPAPPARALLVSDVDSTFLTQEVIELVAEHAGTRAEVQEVTDRAMAGELDFAASLHARVATLAGLDAGVLAEVRAALVPTDGALELIERCRAAGVATALVSGGFHEVIDELAVGVGIDHVLANRFEIAEGTLTGRVSGPVIDAAAKEAALREYARLHGVPLERTVAVGDGANDIAMLTAAGTGVAFRGKPALRAVADLQIEGTSLLPVWDVFDELLALAG